jgi:hypothetical protein
MVVSNSQHEKHMKKTILTLTAIASLTIAAHAESPEGLSTGQRVFLAQKMLDKSA